MVRWRGGTRQPAHQPLASRAADTKDLPPAVGDRAAAAGRVGARRRLRGGTKEELAGYFKLLASNGFAVVAPR